MREAGAWSAVIGVSVWLSLRATRGQVRRALQPPATPPFRVAPEAETAALEPMWRRRPAAAERTRPLP